MWLSLGAKVFCPYGFIVLRLQKTPKIRVVCLKLFDDLIAPIPGQTVLYGKFM
jgi:hypothetical protein